MCVFSLPTGCLIHLNDNPTFMLQLVSPLPAVGHIWDVMLVWSKNWLRATALCTIIRKTAC